MRHHVIRALPPRELVVQYGFGRGEEERRYGMQGLVGERRVETVSVRGDEVFGELEGRKAVLHRCDLEGAEVGEGGGFGLGFGRQRGEVGGATGETGFLARGFFAGCGFWGCGVCVCCCGGSSGGGGSSNSRLPTCDGQGLQYCVCICIYIRSLAILLVVVVVYQRLGVGELGNLTGLFELQVSLEGLALGDDSLPGLLCGQLLFLRGPGSEITDFLPVAGQQRFHCGGWGVGGRGGEGREGGREGGSERWGTIGGTIGLEETRNRDWRGIRRPNPNPGGAHRPTESTFPPPR